LVVVPFAKLIIFYEEALILVVEAVVVAIYAKDLLFVFVIALSTYYLFVASKFPTGANRLLIN
jgi:hypothetical protein